MLFYSLIFVVFFGILFSCGLTFKFIIGSKETINNSTAFLTTFFYGLIFLSFLAACVSIFLPLNYTITIAFGCIGLIGIIINRKIIPKSFAYLKKISLFDFIMLTSIFTFLVFISSNGIYNYDSGLYHIQDIKWTNTYPVVNGLGNLHGRFAFNSLFFTLSSVFSVNHFSSQELLVFPLNTICIYIFLVWQYFNIKALKIKTDIEHIVFILIIVLLLFRYQMNWISSPSPDIICAVISIIVLQKSFSTKFKSNLIFMSCLIFTCIAFKLSTLILVLFLIPLLKKQHILSDFFKIFGIGTLVLAPFFLRNYFISGYLVYPFHALDLFNPDWKIPIDRVIDIQLIIKTWAIIPELSINEVLKLNFTEWFPRWLNRWDILTKIILLSALSLPIISLFQYIKKKYNLALISLFTFTNLLFWFCIAPDIRFAHGFIIFAFAYIIYLVIEKLKYKLLLTITGFVFITLGLFIKLRKTTTTKNMVVFHMLNHASEVLIYPKGYNDLDYKKTNYKKINAGFDYYIPTHKDKCYNCELPCTPTKVEGLVLRGKDLKDGFKIVID